MQQKFDQNPILNSPYSEPRKYWKLGKNHLPTGDIESGRRPSQYFTAIPKATQERRRRSRQLDLSVDGEQEQARENALVNIIRKEVAAWRNKPMEERGISEATQRLLLHWREDKVSPRPFFCQLEAVETFIWLNDVAPYSRSKTIVALLEEIKAANAEASMGLNRLAAKMATGAGKTTVMAMLIAYHTINKKFFPRQERYSNKFLIITPGITIKDRLRVLLPQYPNNYYEAHNIVPPDMLEHVQKAEVVITNYHAFRRREKSDTTMLARRILEGNDDEPVNMAETKSQMLERVCPELLRGKGRVIVINDEAHHCYIHREEQGATDGTRTSVEEKDRQEQAKKDAKAARLWINGINALRERVKEIKTVYDLSATPFFLRGSGYPEGTLFKWVVSDFSLMDAIESGIVKLPRVPVEDATRERLPIYRNLYHHVSKDLPRRSRATQNRMDPRNLPSELTGALQTLYSHYEQTHELWQQNNLDTPPCFIIVCNNTSTSKLVYDYISGYKVPGREQWERSDFSLFDNLNRAGNGLRQRPQTLLIDSYQLESGEALSEDFKQAAAGEIELFRRELIHRGDSREPEDISNEELLREAMNTVGKKGRLGEQIRCVVSVSMLTEGWDTNNVTHILGVRAFGSQLLCEQVVGRALRRYSYELEEEGDCAGQFAPEYADVFGVPFNFAQGTKLPPPKKPDPPVRVRHLPERGGLEIVFPRVRGYRIQPPESRLRANFTHDSRLDIVPEMAPPLTAQQGIVGEGINLNLNDLRKRRINETVFFLAAYMAKHYYQEKEGGIAPSRFRDLVPIVRHWMKNYVRCHHNTFKQYLLWQDVAALAAERISRACVEKESGGNKLLPIIDPFTPEGSTVYVDFLTRKKLLHETREDKSHINIAVCDSTWEVSFCELLEETPHVFAYVRNEQLGFEVPYTHDQQNRVYLPDYIVLIDDGRGPGDLLHLVAEVKGYRNDCSQAKADTMKKLWIPAVNNDGRWGRWAFEEIMDPQKMNPQLLENTALTAESALAKYAAKTKTKGKK